VEAEEPQQEEEPLAEKRPRLSPKLRLRKKKLPWEVEICSEAEMVEITKCKLN
jgi:hypothetical protein